MTPVKPYCASSALYQRFQSKKVMRSPVRSKFLRKMRASFLGINHLNNQMHEMTYIWQGQAPVSINMCLTIECLLKECKAEEIPCVFFLRTVIVNRGNSCELKLKKNIIVLRQWTGLYIFYFESFLSVQI